MPLHLIKLCVGCDSVQDLKDWIKEQSAKKKKAGEPGKRFHRTRMVPKRVDELLDGGSLFWVIRGEVLCRERILGIEPFRDRDGDISPPTRRRPTSTAPHPARATCPSRCGANCANSGYCEARRRWTSHRN